MATAAAVGDETFTTEVLESSTPVLVDFWAEWCGPCRMMEPVLEDIATELGDRLRLLKLNVDDNPTTTQKYGVVSIPTLLLVANGEVKRTWIGAQPKARILKDLKDALPA
jgi:thioredoxin 1